MPSTPTDINNPSDMILAGEPPLAIRKYFPSFKEAVRFYASVRAAQFGITVATERCCACQQTAGDVIGEFEWSATFTRFSIGALQVLLIFIGHLSIPVKKEAISFSTFHPFCSTCWQRSRKMRWLRGLLEGTSIILILVGFTAALGCGLTPVFMDHLNATDKTELFLACAGGVFVAIMAIVIRIKCRVLGAPKSLRTIAPRPFQLGSTQLMVSITVPRSTHSQFVHVPKYRPENPAAMSWQQTVGVLVTIFGLVPGLIMAFASDIDPPYRMYGHKIIASWFVLVTVLTAWHQMKQKKIRDVYYRQMAEKIARRGS